MLGPNPGNGLTGRLIYDKHAASGHHSTAHRCPQQPQLLLSKRDKKSSEPEATRYWNFHLLLLFLKIKWPPCQKQKQNKKQQLLIGQNMAVYCNVLVYFSAFWVRWNNSVICFWSTCMMYHWRNHTVKYWQRRSVCATNLWRKTGVSTVQSKKKKKEETPTKPSK